MSKYTDLKEESYKANMEIPQRNLAIYTWGNVSAFDKNEAVLAIKPSGVPYDELQIEDIVIVDLDGRIVEGKLNPSSDTATHIEIYKAFATSSEKAKKIAGITHTHSPYATAWAQAKKSIPLFGTTHADHSPLEVPCTNVILQHAVEKNYEQETGKLIVDTYAQLNILPHENPMVLVAGHGPFTWGENAHKSVYNAAVLEKVARMAWVTLQINPQAKPLEGYIVNKHYERKHGANSYYGQGK
ncbi:MAG: L-ribulose-5-phosphate 4-epimerase AraD [Treponemataceae bacterium]